MARIVALFTILFFASSCATLFAEDQRVVTVTSSPPGAEIAVNGQPMGITPTRITVNNHEKLVVSVRKQGFHPAGCYMNTSIEAVWLILDILLFYTVVPLVVDLVTNNWSTLEGEFCTVRLMPIAGSAPAPAYPPR